MRLQPILTALGMLLMLTGGAMVPCGIVDFFSGIESWGVFGLTSFMLLGIGGVLVISVGKETQRTGPREAFLLTVVVWVLLPLAATLPFLSLGFSFTDAYFESVSALTTTGATIMTGLDQEQKGLLLWRAILQWIGGVGIIVTAIAILPMLRVGGMQLFKLESNDMSGKFMPRVSEIASHISFVYIGLTVMCAVCYSMAGMTVFEAITHSMTTLSSGGMSTSDQSIGLFSDTRVIEVAIIFMLCASLPFGLFVMTLHGRLTAFWNDPQPRFYLGVIAAAVIMLLAYVLFWPGDHFMRSEEHLVRDVIFSVVSVISGTGYGVTDYGQWGSFSELIFLGLMIIGGCAGSAACGINVFRIEIMFKTLKNYVSAMLSPARVFTVRYGGQTVRDDVLQSVMIFIFLYLMTFSVASVLLSLTGLDALSSISGAATSLSNVGPGLGTLIGPSSTFQQLTDAAKWICTICMLLGRLEIVTFFVVLTPRFWRY